jgi:hypothetical protein
MSSAIHNVGVRWRWAAALLVLVSTLIPIVHALGHHDTGIDCTQCLALHGRVAILVSTRVAMAAPHVTAQKAAPEPPFGTLHHSTATPERGPPAHA